MDELSTNNGGVGNGVGQPESANGMGTPAVASRLASFSVGATPSLQMATMRQNTLAPHTIAPTSVLQPYMKSPNGMAQADADRRLMDGTMRPSPMGQSQETFDKVLPIKMMQGVNDPGAML